MKITTILPLLAAGAVTVLAVAGLSNAASSAVPVNTVEPKISGTAQEGQTLSATSGTWTSSTTLSYAYQWRRCDAQGAGCANIGGADTSSYLVKHADIGDTLRVRVTAKNTDGSAQSTSNQTPVVTAKGPVPPVTVNGCPAAGSGTIDVASITPPARLVIDGQGVSPSVITRSAADVTVRFHVSACNGRSVSGALVYATAVPFQQFSIPAETPTGADGWATMTLHQDSAFPASPRQQLLAVFTRARKSGENLLGGISTRRLVSFPVNTRG
ncbi:MAG: hydrolase family protein [Actinomycetia bacterium]|nr:hydrolase family protein [Actinomycetes bacterium]